jgi:hypothetical protein
MAKKQRQGVSGNPARAAQGSSGGSGAGAKGAGKGAASAERRPGARAAFERASAPVLLFLSRLPRWVFPVVLAAILLTGMLIPSPVIGGILLSFIVLALGWLVALSWPLLSVPSRLLRLLVVGGLALVVYGKFSGRFG